MSGSDTFHLLTSVVWTGEEVGRRVCEVFTELSRELWLLKDLPLAITSLQGTSPVFRHTEVWKGEKGRRESGKGKGNQGGGKWRRDVGRVLCVCVGGGGRC